MTEMPFIVAGPMGFQPNPFEGPPRVTEIRMLTERWFVKGKLHRAEQPAETQEHYEVEVENENENEDGDEIEIEIEDMMKNKNENKTGMLVRWRKGCVDTVMGWSTANKIGRLLWRRKDWYDTGTRCRTSKCYYEGTGIARKNKSWYKNGMLARKIKHWYGYNVEARWRLVERTMRTDFTEPWARSDVSQGPKIV